MASSDCSPSRTPPLRRLDSRLLIFRTEVSMRFRSWLMFLFVAALVTWQTMPAAAQSLTSGDAAGTITDPSGAVVPNATVTLKSNDTGATQTRTTNAQGAYRFSLLAPGTYTISVTASGFQGTQKQLTITV